MSKNSNRRSTVLCIFIIFFFHFYGGDDFHGKSQPLEVQWLVHLSFWRRYEGNLSVVECETNIAQLNSAFLAKCMALLLEVKHVFVIHCRFLVLFP